MKVPCQKIWGRSALPLIYAPGGFVLFIFFLILEEH